MIIYIRYFLVLSETYSNVQRNTRIPTVYFYFLFNKNPIYLILLLFVKRLPSTLLPLMPATCLKQLQRVNQSHGTCIFRQLRMSTRGMLHGIMQSIGSWPGGGVRLPSHEGSTIRIQGESTPRGSPICSISIYYRSIGCLVA